jgi:hypothetical protein
MDASKVLAVLGLLLGVVGAYLNDRATVHLKPNLQGGVRFHAQDSDARWLPWSEWGWRFIIAGLLCGVVAVIVQ